MTVALHPHAVERLKERGATKAEVIYAVRHGRSTPAKFGRTCFSYRFTYNRKWLGTTYVYKKVEALAARQPDGSWLVITVIVRFF
jgi:Domain of unknown function (DUF4258)